MLVECGISIGLNYLAMIGHNCNCRYELRNDGHTRLYRRLEWKCADPGNTLTTGLCLLNGDTLPLSYSGIYDALPSSTASHSYGA